MRETAIVSACLIGVRCRYDGRDALREEILELWRRGGVVPVCPEELGGLGTPRPAAEIEGCPGPGVAWDVPEDLGPFVEVAPAGEVDGGEVWAGRARVMTVEGRVDVTRAYVEGAIAAARRAREVGATKAYLKSKSPACGAGSLVKRGERVPGDGVTVWLFRRMGIEVVAVE